MLTEYALKYALLAQDDRGSYNCSKARLLSYLGLLECIYEAVMHNIIRFQLDDFTDCDPPKHVVFR